MSCEGKLVCMTWPRASYEKYRTGLLVASGRADATIVSVSATCNPVSGADDSSIKSQSLGLFKRKGNAGEPEYKRWFIAFRIPEPGTYVFEVTGLDAASNPHSDRAECTLHTHDNPFIDIIYPGDGEDITAEKDDFLAFGDLQDTPLDYVELKNADGLTIAPLHVASEPQELQFWSAEYQSLAVGVYSLYVVDQGSNAKTTTGIHVDS